MNTSEYSGHYAFCPDLFSFERRKTRIVKIGGIPLGGNYPIRIQSMVNSNPSDTSGTVRQIIELQESGCEYVRLTVPSVNDAKNLENIKKHLALAGCSIPLIADVHFNPAVAELCARIVEKVRINPGNFADEKKIVRRSFSSREYDEAFSRLPEKLNPLIQICRENGTVLRIGTNHGSLSDRIMSRYGDTIEGMVESTLEYVRICRSLNFHELVLSIKSSDTVVMASAYRLLVARMNEENMDYPLHLGVTEAGEGEDGRIKSAIGTGSLLADGIGDTIRVSLAEPPINEIPVAKMIISYSENIKKNKIRSGIEHAGLYESFLQQFDPAFTKARSAMIRPDKQASVIAFISRGTEMNSELLSSLGYIPLPNKNVIKSRDNAADLILSQNVVTGIPPGLEDRFIFPDDNKAAGIKKFTNAKNYCSSDNNGSLYFIKTVPADFENDTFKTKLKSSDHVILIIDLDGYGIQDSRKLFFNLNKDRIENTVIIQKSLSNPGDEQEVTSLSIETGSLLLDGFADGLCFRCDENPAAAVHLAFNILQACRRRIFKTEFVICPTCGRTQFDLQQVAARVKARTSQLKGLKIGIMGCIVNGLGEMGDADYGFIGSGKGMG